jgi:hypothetical protein
VVVYFLAVVFYFKDLKRVELLFLFFAAFFVLSSALILVETFDFAVGVDVHHQRFFEWHTEVDSRIRDNWRYNVDTGNVITIWEAMPLVMGLYGFPHYTAPLYVASFVMTLSYVLAKRDQCGMLPVKTTIVAGLVVLVGLVGVYALGVKTHFVTALLSLGVLALLLWRRLFQVSSIIVGAMIGLSLLVPWTNMRLLNFANQVLIGNDVEGSRLEVIFRLSEFSALTKLSLGDLISGLGDTSHLSRLMAEGYFLEQKLLVYTLVLGVPYAVWLLLFIGLNVWRSAIIVRKPSGLEVKALAAGTGCAIMVLVMDMLHSGSTFSALNYPMLFVFMGLATALHKINGQLIVNGNAGNLPRSNWDQNG